MKLFSLVAALLLSATALAAEPPKELVIETTSKPDDCTVQAQKGDQIQVHYVRFSSSILSQACTEPAIRKQTGTLFADGKKFDSSLDRGQPLPLTLGIGQVIKGWDQGLLGMCEGEERKLTIPADMAYGARGFGNLIPANSALVFTTKLVKLDPKNRDEL
ncbi:Peptidyl-prolyl cis-trans isomerase fpr2 [Marasmius sp. AFHP31]|nr:Peptidyl-prolyl cis-trans isomerase fpr2 [Marasmius sp. AFHP31]